MLGTVIRALGRLAYTYPDIPQDIPRSGPFGQLKVALVADSFTAVCLAAECRIRCLTPQNFREVLSSWKPDLLFVESVFHGVQGSWRYLVGKHPWYFNRKR